MSFGLLQLLLLDSDYYNCNVFRIITTVIIRFGLLQL